MFTGACKKWGGRVVRWCWVNFQCRGVLLIWLRVGQGPTEVAVGAGGGCLDIFSLIYHFSFRSPSLWETARYRLKYCLKGPLSPKTTNQPTCKNITGNGVAAGCQLFYRKIYGYFLQCIKEAKMNKHTRSQNSLTSR